jgi:methionine synthase / methylenetetrahydrofolate reductase (NADH)
MNTPAVRPSIQSLLAHQIVVFDGGMGTTLYAHGIPYSQCFDELNLVRPEVVLEIHAGYVEAGAQVLETNTFGANRYRLAEHNLDQQLVAINQAGVMLARQAAGDRALVAGSIGPLGKHLVPIGNLEPADAALAYREQAQALVAAGVDFLILETITHLEEMVVAVRAVNDLGVPVVALMTFTEEAKSLVGNKPEEVAETLSNLNVAALGANCSVGPQGILEVLERMVPCSRVPVVAMPNAGLPRLVNGRYIYLSSPEYMGDFARKAVNLGVAAVGGCCGTTADHVRALAQAVKSSTPRPPGTALAVDVGESHTPVSTPALPSRYVKSAINLKSKGADAINVADSPLARPRMSPSAFCHILQRDAGVEAILHISCRDRNLLATQSEIMGAHALGIRNVIAVTGDPVQVGGYLKASDVFDLDSVSLTRLITMFNEGTDQTGKPTDEPTQFRICVAANPTAVDVHAEIEKLRRKIDAGAHFIFTQPVYSARDLESFLERFGRLPIPICVGILPLRNARHAEFLHNEIPGMAVPEDIRKRMHASGEHGQEEGLTIAIETLLACRPLCQGAYLMPPFNRFEMAGQVLEGVGAR